MKNPFPTYYVYRHICPETQEVLYVGRGSGGRAWQCGSEKTVLRSKEHHAVLKQWLQKGYTPDMWVDIAYRGCSFEESVQLEMSLIREQSPRFNKPMGEKLLKFTPDVYDAASLLRTQGLSYKSIGESLGISTMVVHRGLNRKNPALERLLNAR